MNMNGNTNQNHSIRSNPPATAPKPYGVSSAANNLDNSIEELHNRITALCEHTNQLAAQYEEPPAQPTGLSAATPIAMQIERQVQRVDHATHRINILIEQLHV